MFGFKRFKNDSGFSAGTTTLIAAGTRVAGDISFTGNLEIEGEVIGNISAEGAQSKVRVLQSGTVTGDIAVATIIVNGHVKGDLHASELVELAAKAVVEGDLNYNLIGIEKGAEVVGRFVYHSAESNITEFPVDRDGAVL
jgi:cytoskeletal protein CcmA (bactofilin family)